MFKLSQGEINCKLNRTKTLKNGESSQRKFTPRRK